MLKCAPIFSDERVMGSVPCYNMDKAVREIKLVNLPVLCMLRLAPIPSVERIVGSNPCHNMGG